MGGMSQLNNQLRFKVLAELRRRKVSQKVLNSAEGDDYTLLYYDGQMSISQMADFEIANA